jgi:hypothetical protein
MPTAPAPTKPQTIAPMPLVVPDEILTSFQHGVLAEVEKARSAEQEASSADRELAECQRESQRLSNEIARLEQQLTAKRQELDEKTRQAEMAKDAAATHLHLADAARTRIPHFLQVVNRIRTDMHLIPWSVCRHCDEQILMQGSAWGHDTEGFAAECRPGEDDSPVAEPVPLPPVAPAATTAADGIPLPPTNGKTAVDTQAMPAVPDGASDGPSGEETEA